jgi:hypothetical protein
VKQLLNFRSQIYEEQHMKGLVMSEKQFTENDDALPCSDHPFLKPLAVGVVVWFTWVAVFHLSRGRTLTGIEIAGAVGISLLLNGASAIRMKKEPLLPGEERPGICEFILGFVYGLMAAISLFLFDPIDS